MKFLVIVAAILATVSAQGYRPADIEYKPIPYSFNYQSDTEDGGSSGHQETGDGSGIVRGSYTVNNLEGHTRVVEYEAGPEGFKAYIRTNEPGTDNSSPANVIFESTAPEARGPIIKYNTEQPSRFGAPAAYAPPAAPARYAPQAAPARYAPPAENAVTGGQGQNVRYVLVPSTDPRARGRS